MPPLELDPLYAQQMANMNSNEALLQQQQQAQQARHAQFLMSLHMQQKEHSQQMKLQKQMQAQMQMQRSATAPVLHHFTQLASTSSSYSPSHNRSNAQSKVHHKKGSSFEQPTLYNNVKIEPLPLQTFPQNTAGMPMVKPSVVKTQLLTIASDVVSHEGLSDIWKIRKGRGSGDVNEGQKDLPWFIQRLSQPPKRYSTQKAMPMGLDSPYRLHDLAEYESLFYMLCAKIRELHQSLSIRFASGFIDEDTVLHNTDIATKSFRPWTARHMLTLLHVSWSVLMDVKLLTTLQNAVKVQQYLDDLVATKNPRFEMERIIPDVEQAMREEMRKEKEKVMREVMTLPGLVEINRMSAPMIVAYLSEKWRSTCLKEEEEMRVAEVVREQADVIVRGAPIISPVAAVMRDLDSQKSSERSSASSQFDSRSAEEQHRQSLLALHNGNINTTRPDWLYLFENRCQCHHACRCRATTCGRINNVPCPCKLNMKRAAESGLSRNQLRSSDRLVKDASRTNIKEVHIPKETLAAKAVHRLESDFDNSPGGGNLFGTSTIDASRMQVANHAFNRRLLVEGALQSANRRTALKETASLANQIQASAEPHSATQARINKDQYPLGFYDVPNAIIPSSHTSPDTQRTVVYEHANLAVKPQNPSLANNRKPVVSNGDPVSMARAFGDRAKQYGDLSTKPLPPIPSGLPRSRTAPVIQCARDPILDEDASRSFFAILSGKLRQGSNSPSETDRVHDSPETEARPTSASKRFRDRRFISAGGPGKIDQRPNVGWEVSSPISPGFSMSVDAMKALPKPMHGAERRLSESSGASPAGSDKSAERKKRLKLGSIKKVFLTS